MREVVVTGLGIVSPIGIGRDAFWDSIMARRSGAAPMRSFDPAELPVRISCEVDIDVERYLDRRDIARTDRFTQLALIAGDLALEDAGFASPQADRTGVVIGSGIGGLSTIEHEHERFQSGGARRVSPYMVPKLMPNAAAAAVAMRHGLRGPNFAPSSACATGAHAIGEAWRVIATGGADAVLAGGTEAAITPLAVAAFARMGALSTRNDDPTAASRPFAEGRDGFVIGEGAGVLVLEERSHAERRGARALAHLRGYGASADAHHVTQPDPEGAGAVLAIEAALRSAGATPSDVDYINAHGTSTPFNDRIETVAIKRALGTESKRIPTSSIKSQTGHLLGAAGAVEAAASVLALLHGVAPGTINLEQDDPECDLDYVADGPRRVDDLNLVLSNSFGFGGQNACLAFGRAS
ncbi:MAG: beta-ketoacyl-ACP synthase II [Actinomycetota bacterium]